MSSDYLEIKSELTEPEYAPRPKPTPIPEASWNDEPLFCVRVNSAWVGHILGVLTALDQPDTWIGTDEEIDATRQQVNEIMAALMEPCEDTAMQTFPTHAMMFHDMATVTVGDDLTTFSPSTAPF